MFLLVVLGFSSGANCQDAVPSAPSEGTIIQAEGEARTKVENDFLSIELAFEKEHALLPKLHEEVQQAAAGALEKAKQSPEVKVKTSGYSIYPVYDRQRMVRQHATYRISLETGNFAAGLSLAAALQPFQISSLTFSVSPERQKEIEKALLQEAIADLRDNVRIAADALGAKTIRITHLTVGARRNNPMQPPMMSEAMAMKEAAPVAAEAGESQVTISVSGSALAR